MKLPDGDRFTKIWQSLRPLQKDFVVAMQTATSKKEAAEQVSMNYRTQYQWNNRDDVEEAIELLKTHSYEAAITELRDSAFTAVRQLVEMLEDDSLRQDVRLQVIKEVIKRTIADSALPSDQQSSDHNISINVKNSDD